MDAVRVEHTRIHFVFFVLDWNSTHHRLRCQDYNRRMSRSCVHNVSAKYSGNDYSSFYGKNSDICVIIVCLLSIYSILWILYYLHVCSLDFRSKTIHLVNYYIIYWILGWNCFRQNDTTQTQDADVAILKARSDLSTRRSTLPHVSSGRYAQKSYNRS